MDMKKKLLFVFNPCSGKAQIKNQLFESALAVPNDTCHFWCENLKMTGAERREIDESWKPVYGERSVIRDHYNEMTLKFSKGEGEGKK